MPEIGIPNPSQDHREALGTTGARKPPKRALPPSVKKANDRRAAKWFNEGLCSHPKAASAAVAAGVGDADLSKMRKGTIAIALRTLLALQDHPPAAIAFCRAYLADVAVAEHPDEVLVLCTELLEEINHVARPKKPVITFEELALLLLRALIREGSPVWRKLIENIAAQEGVSAQQVSLVLHHGAEEP